MKIIAYNPPTTDLEKSYLSTSVAAGVTQIKVKNSDRFADTNRIMIGELGRERTEIVTVDGSPTSTLITVTTTEFPHDADDPVYLLEYDQLNIYRSTSGINGAYSLLDVVDLDVDNAELVTRYDDVNALDTYYYKLSYLNSEDSSESDLSEAIATSGYATDTIGSIIMEVARKVKDPDFIEITVDVHLENANDISDDLITQAKRPYRFLKTNELLNVDADDNSVAFPDDFWKVNYTEVREVSAASTRVFQPRKVTATEMRFQQSQTTLKGDYVDIIAYDDEENLILFNPASRIARTGLFNLHYYKKFTRFTSMSSTIEGPTRLVYKLGLLREYYMMKADDDAKYARKAESYDKKYNTEVMKLQREKNIEAAGPSGMASDKKRYIQWGGRGYRQ